jgi:hypothetical protein
MGVDAEMCVKFDRDVTDEERLRWSWELARVMGVDLVDNQGPFFVYSKSGHLLEFDTENDGYDDDSGEPLNERETRRTLRVSLGGRYYGEGYERGCGIKYVMIGEWLERRTGGRVYYWGDSVEFDEELHLFDAAARSALLDLMTRKAPYYCAGTQEYGGPACERCKQPMGSYLWAGDTTGYACGVCDEHVLVKGGKVTARAFGDWPAPHNHRDREKDWTQLRDLARRFEVSTIRKDAPVLKDLRRLHEEVVAASAAAPGDELLKRVAAMFDLLPRVVAP